MAMQKPKKRIKSKSIQKAYFLSHPYDEWELGFRGRYIARQHIHEIVHGVARKTYEEWNMIALTLPNHDRAHGVQRPPITKRDLFIAKAICCAGSQERFEAAMPPDEIIREFDLLEYWK